MAKKKEIYTNKTDNLKRILLSSALKSNQILALIQTACLPVCHSPACRCVSFV